MTMTITTPWIQRRIWTFHGNLCRKSAFIWLYFMATMLSCNNYEILKLVPMAMEPFAKSKPRTLTLVFDFQVNTALMCSWVKWHEAGSYANCLKKSYYSGVFGVRQQLCGNRKRIENSKIHFSLLPLHAWRLRKSHTTMTVTKEVTYLAASQKHNWDLLQTAQ